MVLLWGSKNSQISTGLLESVIYYFSVSSPYSWVLLAFVAYWFCSVAWVMIQQSVLLVDYYSTAYRSCDSWLTVLCIKYLRSGSWLVSSYKKLSYPQRKCASNVAILYGADGISIWNGIGIWHHKCDRQTAYVHLVAPSVESIYKTPRLACSKGSIAVDSFPPVFNIFVRSFGVNP